MNSISSASLSSLLALAALSGCATRPASAPPPVAAPVSEPAPGTVVTLEFSNATSKASMQVDLSATDLQLEMRARPRRDTSTSTPAGRDAKLPGMSAGSFTATESAPQAAAAKTDSVTRAVVAAIRRAQDQFVAGRYAEALSTLEAANTLKPTAEAHALAGSAAWSLGDREDARRRWRAALDLDPSYPGVAEALARSANVPETGRSVPR